MNLDVFSDIIHDKKYRCLVSLTALGSSRPKNLRGHFILKCDYLEDLGIFRAPESKFYFRIIA